MISVPTNQISFHPASFGDFNGRLFHWDGGLYRGVGAGRAGLYRELIADGTVRRLVERGLLIETMAADVEVDGFEMVLQHRSIPVVSYAYEWSAGMLRDAALLTLDLEIELAARGLTLQDAHPWNVLFDGPVPCWVDFGSIVPATTETPWRAYDEFCRFYLNPLLLMSRGHHRIARRMLVDSDDGVLTAEAEALGGVAPEAPRVGQRLPRVVRAAARRVLPAPVRRAIRRRIDNGRPPVDVSADRPAFLRDLRARVAAIGTRSPIFSTVHVNGSSRQADTEPGRRRAVEYAVGRVSPASVFEVAYASPFYGTAAAAAGTRVVAVGVDEDHVDDLYRHARRNRLGVLPLVMDVRTPSPGYGVCGQAAAPAVERLASDLVIALDATHHLGVRYRLNVDQIAAGLGAFARRAVLVDFVDGSTHPATRAYWTADFAGGYSAAALEAALRRTFAWVERLDGNVPDAPARPTFLCFKEAAAA
jgi:hypothetical protein